MSEPSSTDLIIGIPTQDQRAIVPSILELGTLGQLLHRRVEFVIGAGSNIPRSRNTVVEQIQ